jgi:hypothetical protein
MSTLHETHDQIVSRVTHEQQVLHGGVSDGVEHLGRKEVEAVALALGVGVVVALAVGVPQHWSLVMSVFIGFAAAVGTFLIASIVLVERDDGRVNEQAHDDGQHPGHSLGISDDARRTPDAPAVHPGASAASLSRWTDDGGSTIDDGELAPGGPRESAGDRPVRVGG